MNISRSTWGHVDTFWSPKRIYMRTMQAGINKWQVHVMRKHTFQEKMKSIQWRPIGYITGFVLLTFFLFTSSALAEGSSWKVGRAVISGGGAGSGLSLKVSLRNVGNPSSDQVRVLGRWTRSKPGKKSIQGNDLGSFTQLGHFTLEVQMKQTAILGMRLDSLGAIPAGIRAVELAIITGKGITDGIAVLTE